MEEKLRRDVYVFLIGIIVGMIIVLFCFDICNLFRYL